MKIARAVPKHVVWIARPSNHAFALQKYPQTKLVGRAGDHLSIIEVE